MKDPFAQHLQNLLEGSCTCEFPGGREQCIPHRDANAPAEGRPFIPPPSSAGGSGSGGATLTHAETGVRFATSSGSGAERQRRLQLLSDANPLAGTLAAALDTPTENLPPLPPAA